MACEGTGILTVLRVNGHTDADPDLELLFTDLEHLIDGAGNFLREQRSLSVIGIGCDD